MRRKKKKKKNKNEVQKIRWLHKQWSHWLWKHVDLDKTCNPCWKLCWSCQSKWQMVLLKWICCCSLLWFGLKNSISSKRCSWGESDQWFPEASYHELIVHSTSRESWRGRCGGCTFEKSFWGQPRDGTWTVGGISEVSSCWDEVVDEVKRWFLGKRCHFLGLGCLRENFPRRYLEKMRDVPPPSNQLSG